MNLNETPYALEIEDLSVEFRTRDRTVYAVNGLDLKIRKGETWGWWVRPVRARPPPGLPS